MNKTDLIDAVSKETSLSKKDTEKATSPKTSLESISKKITRSLPKLSEVFSIKKENSGVSFNINSNIKKGSIKIEKQNGKYGLSIFEQTKLPFTKEFKYSIKLD